MPDANGRPTAAELMAMSSGWSSDPREPGPGQMDLPFDPEDDQLSLFDAPTAIGSTPIAASAGEYDAIALNDSDSDGGKATENPHGTPAPLTEVPTSTTNPLRPRTVAAGYDKATKTLTVVFRDGTLYNYYEVTPLTWGNFKRARSKGRYIYTYLDAGPRGFADETTVNAAAHAALMDVAGFKQTATGGLTGTQKATSSRGGRGAYSPGNLGGSTRGRGLNSAVKSFYANRPK